VGGQEREHQRWDRHRCAGDRRRDTYNWKEEQEEHRWEMEDAEDRKGGATDEGRRWGYEEKRTKVE
jgi:hypothetical protein